MAKYLRCPQCRESEELSIVEVHAETGSTDHGRIYLDDHGSIIPPSFFSFSPGDAIGVWVECGSCDHKWAPRRKGGMTVSSWSIGEWEERLKSDDEEPNNG